ncbi:Multiple RNA-binding domain-containing protein 1 [Zancudomyces culisetae]|uniref:Multiple RNA-binding domain-containing protein 1 n=1 Tax=Zancudomyces culisetae TaxID=1213189 RepID=A0A1R1PQY8_ZANCU|nr:Multiple RNA-binding domain-containing protein 1 [Zancudomyces culisetae]|eukprot:OMH83405.1 Multiple RNA-binding domain-containing protein 1 [Zancudomyces culisetae]
MLYNKIFSKIQPQGLKACFNQARKFSTRRIHITNLTYDVTPAHLFKYFSNFGKIEDVYVPKFNDGRYRGFGFITFIVGERPENVPKAVSSGPYETPEEVAQIDELIEKVIRRSDGYEFKGRFMGVDVATSRARVNTDSSNNLSTENTFSYYPRKNTK